MDLCCNRIAAAQRSVILYHPIRSIILWPTSFNVKSKYVHLFVNTEDRYPIHNIACRMLLNATLPRIFQRKVLRCLPAELGQYLLEAGKGFAIGGEIALVRHLSATAKFTHTRGISYDYAGSQVVTDTNTHTFSKIYRG